jgi:hypothetical protein
MNASRLWLAAPAILLLAGCHERTVQGDTATYSFATWVVVTVFAASVVALVVAIGTGAARKWKPTIFLAIGSLAGFLLFGPSMATDRIRLSDHTLELETGIWFAPTKHNIDFDQVKTMTLVTRGSGRRRSQDLVFQLKRGGGVTVPLGDLMKTALDEIAKRVQERGVEILPDRDES